MALVLVNQKKPQNKTISVDIHITYFGWILSPSNELFLRDIHKLAVNIAIATSWRLGYSCPFPIGFNYKVQTSLWYIYMHLMIFGFVVFNAMDQPLRISSFIQQYVYKFCDCDKSENAFHCFYCLSIYTYRDISLNSALFCPVPLYSLFFHRRSLDSFSQCNLPLITLNKYPHLSIYLATVQW